MPVRFMDPTARSSASRLSLVLVALLVLSVPGCGGDDDNPTSPGNGNPNPNPAAGMTATVNGTAWTSLVTTAINTGGIVAIGGSNLNGLIGIGLGFQGTMPGVYDIGPGLIANANVSNAAGGLWRASDTMGSGTITVTTLTATRVAGTFSFTAPAQMAGTVPPTMAVTSGAFDVEFNQTP